VAAAPVARRAPRDPRRALQQAENNSNNKGLAASAVSLATIGGRRLSPDPVKVAKHGDNNK